ncbi:hypothetical protein GALMADRAFT_145037 [Galerina marginata CBS 339.88]|uniref:Uncharacterized protein n=1 Tax=Galerina marginata (strain CBS 339.88) TaxID=685588 RepID=A0A067SGI5_GALM3|nr:hypothetical protein GALMADRAFT_145037 [Galerina marginata CBS 339.88]
MPIFLKRFYQFLKPSKAHQTSPEKGIGGLSGRRSSVTLRIITNWERRHLGLPKEIQLMSWIWGKIVQLRLDEAVHQSQMHRIRKQKNILLPSGARRIDIYNHPEDHELMDCLIKIPAKDIDDLLLEHDRPDLLQFGTDEEVAMCEAVYSAIGSPTPRAPIATTGILAREFKSQLKRLLEVPSSKKLNKNDIRSSATTNPNPNPKPNFLISNLPLRNQTQKHAPQPKQAQAQAQAQVLAHAHEHGDADGKREASMHYRRVHPVKVDENAGITKATTQLGGLVVRDLETDAVLWELPVTCSMCLAWYVRAYAHLEYGEGYMIFIAMSGIRSCGDARRTLPPAPHNPPTES